ncbi:MAG: hypothetical protein NMK33_01930 [Candidatus Cardinium sp.]|uniref:hypothetical protein n=1 Tax=Cardinium endosymbiont of Dermatophagoides farinae TaxID=2597823 RepID=UPI001642DE3B|nr:hypothetical protein [Cardinium endosymbiont of Dermatophagoides farinae]UWW97302.1 MAG: hypothetical protein NMK33_01930 [Candidatus Cardinium sp.]
MILNATTNNPADGFHSTMPVAPFHNGSTTNKLAKLSLKGSMVLDEKVLKDIRERRFSKESMQYWVTQGLSVDAQDQKGQTLLMHAYEAATASKANRFGQT